MRKNRLKLMLLIVIVTVISLAIGVYGAETDQSDAGYNKQAVQGGTWVVSGNGTGTRIYAVTESEMRTYLKSLGQSYPDVIDSMPIEELRREYLKQWDYDNLPYISVAGNMNGIGTVRFCKPDGTTSIIPNGNRLVKMVPHEPVSENGLPGWYTGIADGLYGLDKVKTAYSGYPLTASPSGNSYTPDYPIYNSDGTLKPETMTFTVLETLGKLSELNRGEKVYIFLQVVVKPYIKMIENGVSSYLDPAITNTWGDYFGTDGFTTGAGYVEILKKYNRDNNSNYTSSTSLRENPAITGNSSGANYVRKAILGKYLKETWSNGAMDAMYISITNDGVNNKLHLVNGYERALGVGYQEVTPNNEGNGVIPVEVTYKLIRGSTGSTISTSEDLMPIYALNREQYGESSQLALLGKPDVAFALATSIADSLYVNKQVQRSSLIDEFMLKAKLHGYALGGGVGVDRISNVFVPIRDTYNNIINYYSTKGTLTGFQFDINDTDNQFVKLDGNRIVGAVVIPQYLNESFSLLTNAPSAIVKSALISAKAKKGTETVTMAIPAYNCDITNSNLEGNIRTAWFDVNMDLSNLFNKTGDNKPSPSNPIVLTINFTCEIVKNYAFEVYVETVKLDGTIVRELAGVIESSPTKLIEGRTYVYKQALKLADIWSRVAPTLNDSTHVQLDPLYAEYREDVTTNAGIVLSPTRSFNNFDQVRKEVTPSGKVPFRRERTEHDQMFIFYPEGIPYMLNTGDQGAFVFVLKEKQAQVQNTQFASNYTVPANYLTKQYPERDGGNFPNITVTANKYNPETGTTSTTVSQTTSTSSKANPLPKVNGVTWNSAYDSHSYTTNYNYYTRKVWVKQKEEWNYPYYGNWYSDGTGYIARNASLPSDTDTRRYVNRRSYNSNLDIYDIERRTYYSGYWSWVDTSDTMQTCSPSGSSAYPSLPTSTTSLPSGYRWRESESHPFSEVRDYSHTYTFYDTFTHPFAGFEEFGVKTTQNNVALIENQLNSNRYKSSNTYQNLTLSGINLKLLFSRGTYGDRPTLASWRNNSNAYPLDSFPVGIVPQNTRLASGSSLGTLSLQENENTIRWTRDYARGVFDDVNYEYSSFTVPTLPQDNISALINTFIVQSTTASVEDFRAVRGSGNDVVYFANQTDMLHYYPEVQMKYQDINGTESNVYVVGDQRRSFNPVMAVRVRSSDVNTEMKMEAPYARDKNAVNLDNSISNYSGVVPSGSAFAIQSTDSGRLIIETYHVRAKSAYSSAWGNNDQTLQKHNNVVNAIYNAIPKQLKFKVENEVISNLNSRLKFNPNINIAIGNTATRTSDFYVTNAVNYPAGTPSDIVDFMNNSNNGVRLLNSLVKGADGGWYNEETSNTLEVVVYTTELTFSKPRTTGTIPFEFGPETGKFTSQYKNGYRAEFYYDITPPVEFDFNGKRFTLNMNALNVLNRRFIISDNSVDDF